MKQRDIFLCLCRRRGLVHMCDLRNAGVGPETVARLVREGVVERVARLVCYNTHFTRSDH